MMLVVSRTAIRLIAVVFQVVFLRIGSGIISAVAERGRLLAVISSSRPALFSTQTEIHLLPKQLYNCIIYNYNYINIICKAFIIITVSSN